MSHRRFLTALLPLALAGCHLQQNIPLTGSGSVSDFLHTASGYLIEARNQAAATIELGKMGIEKTKQTVDDLKNRADELQQGIGKIEQGKAQVEKAMAK